TLLPHLPHRSTSLAPAPRYVPAWPVRLVSTEHQCFAAVPPPRRPTAKSALRRVARPISRRNIPANGRFRVYVPVLGKFLCFPGIGNVPVNSPLVPSQVFLEPPLCLQCPSDLRVRERLPTPVRTT